MIKSMTGFGRGEHSTEQYKCVVEIRTVNHRYADFSVRMSRKLSVLEDKIRKFVLERVSRGKVEVNLLLEDYTGDNKVVELDEPLAGAYVNALERINETFALQAHNVDAQDIAKFPDVLKVRANDIDEDVIWVHIQCALEDAVCSLLHMRSAEGAHLNTVLSERADVLEQLIAVIAKTAPDVVTNYKKKLEDRLQELLDNVPIDETRLATEIAFFADKCSIDEELQRLDSHIMQFRKLIAETKPVGRKLDFLVQEMNREINTIGSKASDLTIVGQVVEAKSEIEKIREQVQNVE